ncbi:MAG: IPT/TIG domain-containing protein, partial [Gammaproteobacteria bacterium]|nr:IPT/TIG domain-containing protein [Gammaproteobacteria bacterium]
MRLNLGLLRQSEAKSAGEPLVVSADSLPAPTVAPGESYRIIATAIFESGKELNVSLASDFALANTPFATLIGNELIVNADAPHGTGLEISAIYTEFDGDPVQKTVRLIVGPGSGFDDFDLDGLPDDWERTHFGDLRQNPEDDPDLDGLTNEQEYLLGTNPKLADTDGDGIPDGEEVANGTDPKAITPRVTSVAPNRVWLFGGGEAHIAGANFTADSSVNFAGSPSQRVPEAAHSNQDIFVTVPPRLTIPAGAGGEVVVDLDVRHPSNERGSIPFTYVRYLKTQETAVGVTGDVTTSAFFFDRESGSGDRTFVLDGDTPALTGMLNIPPIADRGTGPVFAMIRATRT